ncbi:hypothetical protein NEHOM01_1402 [Nematocida homosporus]|uniref:uncharacterized protein n=1 Tax=Nematocida homosporus TaxID=1912981 RepID=UPI0022202646|nr:uncharacterized protein NEHOM01_1402 [Nematocida homosporus]KAI5186338.1 hypothetical protein NEHOM01_1402 [Nematocida homosporus]
MSDWDFLRRPAKAKPDPPAPIVDDSRVELINLFVSFGGTQKVFRLRENSSFKPIYDYYEDHFNVSVTLRHQGLEVSKYAKVDVLTGGTQTSLFLEIFPQEINSGPNEPTPIPYNIRYNPRSTLTIYRDCQTTIGQLVLKAQEEINHTAKVQLSPSVFVFNGDVLPDKGRIDDYLEPGDLIDLVPKTHPLVKKPF